MRRKRHTPEQIIAKLRETDKGISEGRTLAEIAKGIGVSEVTLHRWRNQFGGMKGPDAKRLKELEKENSRLKKMVAEQALDIEMLKEVAKGNF